MMFKEKKIAIIYDWLDKWGGVERLLLVLHERFPNAVFFTSYTDLRSAPWAKTLSIHNSFIQRLPTFIKKSRLLSVILYPFAFESFDLSPYDLVISVTSSFAKSVVTKPDTLHMCILLTPTRYFWLYPETYINSMTRKLSRFIFSYLKKWDKIVSRRPDVILSISKEIKKRCLEFYGIRSEVMYPPFDMEHWGKIKKMKIGNNKQKHPFGGKKYFLVVSRLEPYKKIDVVIDLFVECDRRHVVIVGKGSLLEIFKKRAKTKNIIFMQDIPDHDLAFLYQNAEALIMPQNEDFGYTALEAQYFDCPVIAYKAGGAQETVKDRKTGIFFTAQTSSSLDRALERFEKISYNLKHDMKKIGHSHLERFSKEKFLGAIEKNIINLVQSKDISMHVL
ncbi:MAG: glycosyltransferase [Patescibacteria group bacterium]